MAQRDADVGSRSQPLTDEPNTLVRREEEAALGTTSRDAGAVRVRKHVSHERVDQLVPREIEYVDELERVPAEEGDSGEVETLPDGSVSIPVLEEEIVITKRTVVRERVVVRKRTETERRRVEAELRKERVEVEAEGGADVEVDERED